METDLVRLQRKLAKVTALFTSQSNELREKDKALSEKEAELVSVSTANAELLEENSKIQRSLSEALQTQLRLQQAHAAAESAAKKNAADLDAVTKDLVNNEFHAKFELDQRHEQTDQLRKLRGRNENLEARLRQALEDVAERDRDLIRTRAALADSNSNASTLSQQLTALTEEHGRVCAELTDTAGSLKECAQERDGLASQLKAARQELNSELDALSRQHSAHVSSLEKRLSETNAQLGETTRKANTLESENKHLRGRLNALTEDAQADAKSMTALEADLARLRYQLKSVALSEKERSAASDSLRAKLARLESEELPRQKASADAAIAEAVRHLQSLKEAQDVTDSTLLSMEDLRRTCASQAALIQKQSEKLEAYSNKIADLEGACRQNLIRSEMAEETAVMATKRSEVDLQRVREIESLLEEEQHKTAQEALAVKKAVEEAGLAWAAHRTIEQQMRLLRQDFVDVETRAGIQSQFLATQIRGLEEEIYTLTSKCTSLEADNADALSSVRTLTTSVKEAELEKRALLLELSRARGLTSLQESKMKSLENDSALQSVRVSALRTKIDTAHEEHATRAASLQSTIRECRANISRLELELAASHEANAKQKALSDRQLVELKLRFDEQLEQMVKDSEKRWEDVKVANATRVTDLARELDLTRADLVSSEATALSLKAQLQSAQEAEVLAQDRASVVAQDHSRLREELANAEKKYAAILQELLATKALVVDPRPQLGALAEKIQTLESELLHTKAELDQACHDRDNLSKACDELQSSRAALSERVEELNTQATRDMRQIHALNGRCLELCNEVAGGQHALAAAEQEAKRTQRDLEKQAQALSSKVELLEGEVSRLTAASQAAATAQQEAEAALANLRGDFEYQTLVIQRQVEESKLQAQLTRKQVDEYRAREMKALALLQASREERSSTQKQLRVAQSDKGAAVVALDACRLQLRRKENEVETLRQGGCLTRTTEGISFLQDPLAELRGIVDRGGFSRDDVVMALTRRSQSQEQELSSLRGQLRAVQEELAECKASASTQAAERAAEMGREYEARVQLAETESSVLSGMLAALQRQVDEASKMEAAAVLTGMDDGPFGHAEARRRRSSAASTARRTRMSTATVITTNTTPFADKSNRRLSTSRGELKLSPLPNRSSTPAPTAVPASPITPNSASRRGAPLPRSP